jgi:membrane protease YdiL (CAAX protease family)
MKFVSRGWQRTPATVRVILTSLVILVFGALGWSTITFGSLQLMALVPRAGGPLALLTGGCFLWGYWRYLGGAWLPRSTAELRRRRLRAHRLPARVWFWALITGVLAIVSFVCLVHIWGWFVRLPPWSASSITHYSFLAALCVLIGAAAEAGVVEEATFRGYMQESLEEQSNPTVAVAVAAVLFGLVHIVNGRQEIAWLLPYTVFGAILGILAYTTNSIVPGILLHAGVDAVRFWLAWRTEPTTPHALIWQSRPNAAFWLNLAVGVVFGAAAIMAQRRLAVDCHKPQQTGGAFAESPE